MWHSQDESPSKASLSVFPPYLGTSFIHRVVSCKEDRGEPEELGLEGEKKKQRA